MHRAQLSCRRICSVGVLTDHVTSCRLISSSHCYSRRIQFFPQWINPRLRIKLEPIVVISCKSSFGGFNHKSDDKGEGNNHGDEEDYVEAIVLISETVAHHHMRMNGFQEETSWRSSLHLAPFSIQRNNRREHLNSIGWRFLRRFQSPTIFLKISCDGDFVLPIVVGEYAVEKLIESFDEEERGDSPNQFQLVRNLTGKLGYEVKMVKITERVINTYYARIFFHKPGEQITFSLDARPSDAINVAERCKAPIYVNKQIVLADATRILSGMGRMSNRPIYDVSLDSAADGPDLLSEELNLVRNMNLAAEEERYNDAAMWRDKLMRFRKSNSSL